MLLPVAMAGPDLVLGSFQAAVLLGMLNSPSLVGPVNSITQVTDCLHFTFRPSGKVAIFIPLLC